MHHHPLPHTCKHYVYVYYIVVLSQGYELWNNSVYRAAFVTESLLMCAQTSEVFWKHNKTYHI